MQRNQLPTYLRRGHRRRRLGDQGLVAVTIHAAPPSTTPSLPA
jgi:hypothetical protein